jgi:hypothetical protein
MRVSTRRLLVAGVLTGAVALGSACRTGLTGSATPAESDRSPAQGTGGAGYFELEEFSPEPEEARLNLGGNPLRGSLLAEPFADTPDSGPPRIFEPEDTLGPDS